jgi:hypothetical protein
MTTPLALAAHSLLLNEAVYKSLAADKKRPLFLHEWLCYLERQLPHADRAHLRHLQPQLTAQLLGLFGAFPGPPLRHLIASNTATLFSLGDVLELHATIHRCVIRQLA